MDSVKFIFQSAIDEASAADTTDSAQRIVTYLAERGQATRTELSKGCFSGHVSKATLDKALDELLTASPPVIEVETVPRPKGQPGSPSKYYKPCVTHVHPTSTANSANSAEREAPWAPVAAFGATRNVRSRRNEVATETQNLPEFAHFAGSAAPQEPALTRMDIDTSQISQSSLAQAENLNADDVEVF